MSLCTKSAFPSKADRNESTQNKYETEVTLLCWNWMWKSRRHIELLHTFMARLIRKSRLCKYCRMIAYYWVMTWQGYLRKQLRKWCIIQVFASRNGILVIVPTQLEGRPKNRDSISVPVKWIFSSTQRSESIWGSLSLLFNGCRVSFPRNKAAGVKTHLHLELKLHVAIPLFHCMPFCSQF